jgi:predicted DNA-binding protein (UPF0251 family)
MSPRPRKQRKCFCPFGDSNETIFKPARIPLLDLESAEVLHDEIEAVNLCDGMGLTQEQAGQKLGVSRGTVQRLVTSGRRKIIDAIVGGKALRVVQ